MSDEERARHPVEVGTGGTRRDRPRSCATSSPDENEQRCSRSSRLRRRARSPSRRVTPSSTASTIREGAYLGLVDDAAVVSGRRSRRRRERGRRPRARRTGRSILTILTGEDAPPLDGLARRHRAASIPTSRCSTSTRAGSRTTRCSSSRSDGRRTRRSAFCSSRTRTSIATRSSSCSARDGPRDRRGRAPTARRPFVPVREHAPDVVVLDYRLPDVDGGVPWRGRSTRRVVFLSASAGRDGVRCRVERGSRPRAQGRGHRSARSRSPCSGREVTQ